MDPTPPRAPWSLPLRLALIGSLGVSLYFLGQHLVDPLAYAPVRLERARTLDLQTREQEALTPRVPRLFEGAELVTPIFDGAGHLEVPLVYMRGESQPPFPAIEGAVLLGYHFAPGARMVGLPLDFFRMKLGGQGPGQPAPEILQDLQGAEVLLVGGLDEAGIEELVAFARQQFGGAPVLTRGKSHGTHHVLLVGNLPDRIREDADDARRYRSLLR